ncbi:MAG: virulence factor MviN [Cellulomonadaceae bacterium]|nr:virulence factor MviN [Cellulomonadaceae bacterium]
MNKKAQTVASAALLITAVTLASRIVGFGRWMAQGWSLGSGGVGQPFNTANTLPNILFEVAAGGALAGAIVPLVAGPLARAALTDDGSKDAHTVASRNASALLGWTLTVLIPLGGIVAIAARPITTGLLNVTDPVIAEVATGFLRVFALQIPLYGLAVVLGGILQAHCKFFWPAFAPLISSLVVIGVYVGFRLMGQDPSNVPALTTSALNWLAWGTTAGVAFLAIPLLLPAYRTGLRIRPTLRFPEGEGSRALRLASAGIGALIAQQLSALIVLRTAQGFGTTTYSVFLYTQQVYLLPYAVLAFPIATSAFPKLTELASRKAFTELNTLVSNTTRALLVAVSVGVAALIAASRQIGAVFDLVVHGDAPGMAMGLTFMAPGLLGFALILHLSRVLYAVDRGRAAVMATAAGWLVVALLAALAPVFVGHHPDPSAGIAVFGAATTVGMLVAGIGLMIAVRTVLGPSAIQGLPRTVGLLVLGIAAGGAVGHLIPIHASPLINGEVRFSSSALGANLGLGAAAGVIAIVVMAAIACLDPNLRRILSAGVRKVSAKIH